MPTRPRTMESRSGAPITLRLDKRFGALELDLDQYMTIVAVGDSSMGAMENQEGTPASFNTKYVLANRDRYLFDDADSTIDHATVLPQLDRQPHHLRAGSSL